MGDLLAGNPLLLLFVITAISYPPGRVKIKGTAWASSHLQAE